MITGPPGADWAPAAQKVSDRLGVAVGSVVIGPGQEVTDLYFDWAKLRGVAEDGAVLVRPDKHVGWRADRLPARSGRRPLRGRLRNPEPGELTMSLSFEHVTLGQRVLFGTGAAAANLAAEVARLGAERVMVIASDFETPMARAVAAGIEVALWHHDVVMHVPVEVAEKARAAAAESGIDLLVCVGGGSTTGLAKAVAMTTRMPIIAVPTTYAGSEATNVWGLTEASRKTTGVDDAVLPVTVIYDAALTLSLPVDMSVASGLNGMAHCIDSMWAPRADPINAALAPKASAPSAPAAADRG